MIPSSKLLEISDSKGRPLIKLRQAPNGDILTIMMRYRDMTEDDKNAVRGAFESASHNASGGESDGQIGDIEKFLNFEEERPCG